MEGDELICNSKKCRKRITDAAYVTSCSHVFCDEDGTKEFSKSDTCPACQTKLSYKFDIVRNNLQPSEQYKSMILAGLKPDVICEVASRALSFWTYQTNQEKTYQEYTANKAKERATQLEQYYEHLITRTRSELNNLKLQLTECKSTCKREIEETKQKYNEVTEKLVEKNRQHQKLQSMYDSMRRKYMTTLSNFSTDHTSPSGILSCPTPHDNDVLGGGMLFQRSRSSTRAEGLPQFSPKESRMVHGDDLPRNQVKETFSIGLNTPRR